MRLGLGLGVTALVYAPLPIPPVVTGPIALGIDGAEQLIKDGVAAMAWPGMAGVTTWDTDQTVTSVAQFRTAMTTVRNTASTLTKKHRIVCDWDGIDTDGTTTVTLQGKGSGQPGWSDGGGGIYVVNATGKRPAFGNTVTGVGMRGLHIKGVGFAARYSGTGSAETQYCLAFNYNSSNPAVTVAVIEDAGIGAYVWDGAVAQSEYIGNFNTTGVADYLEFRNCTAMGGENGFRVQAKAVKFSGCDIGGVKQDFSNFFGHSGVTAGDGQYYAHIWIERQTLRRPANDIASRNSHQDGAQTGTSGDIHLGYRVLITDTYMNADHSYAGDPGAGGGSQGSYNDDHLNANNLFVIRRSNFAVSSPAGFAYYSPKATHVSYIDRSVFGRCGSVPSNFPGDTYTPQDFSPGVLFGTAGQSPAGTEPLLVVTNTAMGTTPASARAQLIDCVTVNYKANSAGITPETAFAGRDFSRGGAPVNNVAGKFGFTLPNEANGSQAAFVADMWANFRPIGAYAGKFAPDPTTLNWTAPNFYRPSTAAVSAVNADGWSAEWKDGTPPTFTPDSAPQTLAINRAGFDGNGNAIVIPETLVYTARVSQPYPNYGQPTPTTVALSDYVYAGDAVPGVTNNAADPSPKPIVGWTMPHRLRVGANIGGSAVPVSLVAHHRDARAKKGVAGVRFLITDSAGTTKSVVVSTPSLTPQTGAMPVIEYVLPLTSVSDLADGMLTINAEVWPHLGVAASIAKSATDGNAPRGFAPRYFLKTSTPPTYVYVSANGNDTSGVASQTEATAAATPCLTVMGALAKGVAAAGKGDDVEIRHAGDGTVALGNSAADRVQQVAAVLVTAAPGVSVASAVISHGVAGAARLVSGLTIPTAEGGILFRGITWLRTANVLFNGTTTYKLELQFDGCTYNSGGIAGAYISSASDAHFGTTFVNLAATSLSETTANQRRIFRQCSGDLLGTGTLQSQFSTGCSWDRPANYGTLSSGAIFMFNRVYRCINSIAIGASNGVTQVGFANVQNVLEFTSATSNPLLRISPDSATDSTDHVCVHNNTFVGAGRHGRWNVFYDETPGAVRRTHKRASVKGNITPTIFTKSGEFLGTNGNGSPDTTNAPLATGNWPFLHGVGCLGNVALYMCATPLGGSEAQIYPGLGSSVGTQQYVPTQATGDMYASYQGTTVSGTGVGTAGAGGGDYSLKAGAISKAKLPSPLLPFDLAGNARATSADSAGAYA